MKTLFLCLMMAALVCTSGCADYAEEDAAANDSTDVAASEVNSANVESATVESATLESATLESVTAEIMSENLTYPAYLAAPADGAVHPAVVMIHSFNGFEPGYADLTDMLASEGYMVISPHWQAFERAPRDEVVEELIRDSVSYLRSREDVDPGRLGLTGFCAGGRYTMLFLPQMEEFESGVAWYGFPYSGGFANQTRPADVLGGLEAPMLMIHGSRDSPSPISGIYEYATALDDADKYFELKVYQGQPHGFMIEEGELSQSFAAKDAYREMVAFFDRTLK